MANIRLRPPRKRSRLENICRDIYHSKNTRKKTITHNAIDAWKGHKMKHGKIHPKKTMFLRIEVGKATGINNLAYDLTLNAHNNTPIVESQKSGKWFTLSWTDIINLAVKAGINKP